MSLAASKQVQEILMDDRCMHVSLCGEAVALLLIRVPVDPSAVFDQVVSVCKDESSGGSSLNLH